MIVTGTASAVVSIAAGEPVESPAAFLEVAQELSRAAKVLSSDPPLSVGFALLAGHAAELALKSFLLSRGVRAADLAPQFGHDLSKAWQAAHACGLPVSQVLPQWLLTISSLHDKPYLLRYPRQNSGFVLPPLAECAAELSSLLDSCAGDTDEHDTRTQPHGRRARLRAWVARCARSGKRW